MRRRSLHFRLLATALVAALASTACGVGGGNDDTGSDSLTMTVWTTNPDQLRLLNELGDAFSQENGGTKIEIQSIPQAEYLTKLSIRLSGGTAPDLGWMGAPDAVNLAQAGQLADLGGTLTADPDYNFDDFVPAAFTNWRTGGKVWGVPFSTSPFFAIYNKDLLAQAGATDPGELATAGKWDWAALTRTAEAVQRKLPAGSYAFQSNDGGIYGPLIWTTLEPLIRAYGARVFDPATGACELDSPQAIAAVQTYRDMAFTDGTAVPPGTEADFFAGKAAMTFTQLSRLGQLAGAKFDWGVAPLPAGPAGPVYFTGQAGVVAFENGRNKDRATAFVKFLTSVQGVETLAASFPPARRSVLDKANELYADGPLPLSATEQVVVPAISNGLPFAYPTTWPQVQQTAGPIFDELWKKESDVPAVLDRLCQQIDPLLRQGKPGS